MKRYLTIFALCYTFSSNAQIVSHSSCDTNLDGEVGIADVTNVTNQILGKSQKGGEVVTVELLNSVLSDINEKLDIQEEVLDRLKALETAGAYKYPNTANVYEYVDLGLPSGTLWATCNIGASTPENPGDYIAWGETSTKDQFSTATYAWYADGNMNKTTKYCLISKCGTVDNKTVLDSEDDAATINFGQAWCMPSIMQYEELINNAYTSRSYVSRKGLTITSKVNGNSIFLPAAGCEFNQSLDACYYWTRNLNIYATDYTDACYFRSDFSSSSVKGSASDDHTSVSRFVGMLIRPVYVLRAPKD